MPLFVLMQTYLGQLFIYALSSVEVYVEDHFQMKHSEIWSNFGHVFVFLAVFALLSLRFINHQKR